MGKNVLISITSLMALAIIVGGYNRLAMAHGNTDSFVTFLATILAIDIPAYIGMIKASQAHKRTVDMAGKVEEVANDAATAAEKATQAENNTNGKMAKQFEQLRAIIGEVDHKLSEHLIDHNGGS